MPKMIDSELKACAVRLVNEHHGEYPLLTAAAGAVAKQLGIGKESVRRWVLKSQIADGKRRGATREELDEIKALKSTVRRVEEEDAVLEEDKWPLTRNGNPPGQNLAAQLGARAARALDQNQKNYPGQFPRHTEVASHRVT
jgi:transposase